jgi:hypothetical protein
MVQDGFGPLPEVLEMGAVWYQRWALIRRYDNDKAQDEADELAALLNKK